MTICADNAVKTGACPDLRDFSDSTMVSFLLALVVLVILLQAGLMAMLRKLLQQLQAQGARLAALEQRAEAAPPPPPPSSATFHLQPAPPPPPPPPPAALAEPAARIEPTVGAPRAPADARQASARADDAERLRGEMIELMHQLVAQGMSVREIAARCGLSEAEAELMLRLRDGAA
jgi:type IV secretory pathway VirB10-like protein